VAMQRLQQVKLNNFKSFADTTSIPIVSRLTAIVGPNGCGKSNVVDAIRWVVGESSAKQLRGQSMSDVIFNGSTQRKPVGKASVELVFDNSDGWVSGEYAKFTTISIKREVEREGQSSYYINGTACRRRDILHVFLGTGLGSRSYAIIEQGMISRLVEAKPEDMRAHLEEVAGISKYKDRRRDTENRMRRTTENLDRVNDIREELATQLRRLKRQANAAERYKVLKAEELQVESQIKALMWQSLEELCVSEEQKVQATQVRLDEQVSLQRQAEREIEETRQQETQARDSLVEEQKGFYAKAADIARIEQQVKDIQDQSDAWNIELNETSTLINEVNQSSQQQRDQMHELGCFLDNLAPEKLAIQSNLDSAQGSMQSAEDNMKSWQSNWEEFQLKFQKNSNQHESAKTSLRHLSRQVEQLIGRLEQLNQNKGSSRIELLEEQLQPLELQVVNAKDDIAQLQKVMDDNRMSLQQQRQKNQDLAGQIKQLQKDFQSEQTRLASLEALQQAAQHDEVSQKWIESQGLDSAPRLGDGLNVDSGWELAVETVLSQQFNAVCVDRVRDWVSHFSTIEQGDFVFVEKSMTEHAASIQSISTPLSSHVRSEWDLSPWLYGIFAVENVQDALDLREKIQSHESIITRDGVWVGVNWIKVSRAVGSDNSVLLRKQEIELSQQKLATFRHDLDLEEELYTENEKILLEMESAREDQHKEFKRASAELSKLQADLSARSSRFSELKSQQERVLRDIDETQKQHADLIQQHDSVDMQLRDLATIMVDSELKRKELMVQKNVLSEQVGQARDNLRLARQKADQIDIKFTSNTDQLTLLQQTLERQDKQVFQMQERKDFLQGKLKSDDGSSLNALKNQLQQELSHHVVLEQQVKESELVVQHTSDKMSELEKQRSRFLRATSEMKDQQQELEMKKQELTVRQATVIEQLESIDIKLSDVLESLPDEANQTVWKERAASLERKIRNLGSINLAAIEEYETLSERKNFLDSQCADLDLALETLNDAIKKIDRETRTRFKETFEKVNTGFSHLFPKIFGGGSAYLELEENDLLTSGVLLKAQPPGKRNSSIQMLSGGEKALTAIALVFALFRLNPAPFCILDEVDAPLDDVNVGRFCNLVKEMSEMTQFLMISHNKVSISMADTLMGVTMQEAGVSRIVSVDVDAAIEMAEA
jgi:chromosome segregation protein